MKKIGVVKAVLAGKTVPYAHGAQSAINKQVLPDRQHATELGFTSDEQGDPRFHGGIQKALHIYPSEHYPIWQQELGERTIFQSAGGFGENISSEGVTESTICLKDKIRIGSTLLEVSQGRMPCWKLNVRFDQHDMARRLQDTLRTGWYFRVLEEGDIGAGDEIILCERPYPEWPLARIMGAVFTGCLDREELTKLSELPLVESWGKLVERRLETGEVEDWEMRLVGPTRQ
ncbi:MULTISPECIES: MOSC domain-containing protein [Vibrio diabolicus subgroup]|uniref:MOSC domain-containing protein n=1 Tax=Vibrio diabolicus subgroup TaxID=2315253 RepID=UPI00211A901F|nr:MULTISPECIES: MOSC domain-containing protein [Vibrio diabolicus subgroup]MCQ9064724.1 MOSC domain-containing protein [Vibrio diabolicus]MCR9304126.1 MOSC domain-containing protein [Vibrio diabolicus]MCR9427630.1 MOSC domain-containing protein [Vibrio diabolicus]MCR9626282.1 MOSC domain-containing protein [Vibrio antiquarius]MCR9631303.1 MOSC domain-containing protein [Vibrio antiquarius]